MAKHRARVKAARDGQLKSHECGGCRVSTKVYRWLGMEFYQACHCLVRLKDWCIETNWKDFSHDDGPIKSVAKALTA